MRAPPAHRPVGAGEPTSTMPPMEDTITVAERFNGPPASGNGGYVCGLLGSRFDGPAEVTLRAPPPLDQPLEVRSDGDRLLVLDGDTLVAEAAPTTVDDAPPTTVTLEVARSASQRYAGLESHEFPTCFVCGPRRAEGDGLRIFAGPVDGAEVAASPWTPPENLAENGQVRPEIVWASLDCPSFFGAGIEARAVLGRFAVDVRAPVLAGEPHIVIGWGAGSEGRKHFAASAVTSAAGELLAVSRATWIIPRESFPTG